MNMLAFLSGGTGSVQRVMYGSAEWGGPTKQRAMADEDANAMEEGEIPYDGPAGGVNDGF